MSARKLKRAKPGAAALPAAPRGKPVVAEWCRAVARELAAESRRKKMDQQAKPGRE